jgi:hypothetical protein
VLKARKGKNMKIIDKQIRYLESLERYYKKLFSEAWQNQNLESCESLDNSLIRIWDELKELKTLKELKGK